MKELIKKQKLESTSDVFPFCETATGWGYFDKDCCYMSDAEELHSEDDDILF